jgi:hypothetical protein
LISNRNRFDIKPILDSLRASIGDSEFGYRMQALFAHVLLELGSTITEVNQQGHPDIRSVKNGKTALSQVKSITHSYAGWVLTVSSEDIAGIRPSHPGEVGYFAVLDCATPVSWVISGYSAIRRHEKCSVSIETIRASADSELSSESTGVFAELLMRYKDNLHLLTFSVLRERALRGERL